MSAAFEDFVGGDNAFRDLGFPEGEAQNLLLRADLVTQPRMNDLVKGRTEKFTLDVMVNVAAQLGYIVKLSLKKAA